MAITEEHLRELLEARIAALERRLDDYMEAHRREQDAALNAMDKRLEGMNEFRQQVNDIQSRTLPRVEGESWHLDLTKRSEAQALALQTKVGQEEMRGVWKFVWMATGMAVLLSFLIPLAVSMWQKK